MNSAYRKERIERLLNELRYEVEVGMLHGEIDETIDFHFMVPVSKSLPNGIVVCQFTTRPKPRDYWMSFPEGGPRLRVVK